MERVLALRKTNGGREGQVLEKCQRDRAGAGSSHTPKEWKGKACAQKTKREKIQRGPFGNQGQLSTTRRDGAV